jgi:hypothetical protein
MLIVVLGGDSVATEVFDAGKLKISFVVSLRVLGTARPGGAGAMLPLRAT